MTKIFISYSHSNKEQVESLANDLTLIKYEIWYDNSLIGGQEWWETILENIRTSDIIIIGLSKESLCSEACRRELKYSISLRKSLLPISLTDDVNFNLLPDHLAKFQAINYKPNSKESLIQLVNALKNIKPSPSLPENLPTPPPIPQNYLSLLKEKLISNEILDLQVQKTIVFDLKQQLKKTNQTQELLEILSFFKQRDDLFVKIKTEIDEIENILKIKNRALDVEIKPIKVSPDNHHANFDNKQYEQKRTFNFVGVDYKDIAYKTEKWLVSKEYKCQQIEIENNLILQVSKNTFLKYIGMSTSLNIIFKVKNNRLLVEINKGKWIDKAVVGGISLALFAPLAVTNAIGIWQQIKLPEDIFKYIEQMLQGHKVSSID